jgi:hypothetical protein
MPGETLVLEKVSVKKCNTCFSEGFYKIYNPCDSFGEFLKVVGDYKEGPILMEDRLVMFKLACEWVEAVRELERAMYEETGYAVSKAKVKEILAFNKFSDYAHNI